MPARQFDKVIKNLRYLRGVIPRVPFSRQLGIGHLVVPPYNHQQEEILATANLADELQVDYVAYRPVELAEEVSQELWQTAQASISLAKKRLKDKKSHTVALGGVGNRWDTLKPGSHPTGVCDAKPLVAVLQANGDIAYCILHRNKRDMRIGNIHEGTFAEQWFGSPQIQAWQSNRVDGCPNPCKFYRYNEIVRSAKQGKPSAPQDSEVAHHQFL